MVLPRRTSNELWNLDYDKIHVQKVQFLPTIFDGDALFKFPLVLPNAHGFLKMHGMDKKYDGHAWCKVIMTNIKNNFGLKFRKIYWLGHLHCV